MFNIIKQNPKPEKEEESLGASTYTETSDCGLTETMLMHGVYVVNKSVTDFNIDGRKVTGTLVLIPNIKPIELLKQLRPF